MIAPQVAPEIDRLVLSVNGQAMENDKDELQALATEAGLDTLTLLPQVAEFLLAGRLPPDLAVIRMRYRPPEAIVGRLDELASGGFIEETADGYVATASLRPVLEAVLASQAATAASMWSGYSGEVETAAAIARQVIDGTSDDHLVAVVHRQLPEPTDAYALLHRRSITLRYIRQHDHAEAWLAEGLTPADMVILTSLWKGERPEASEDAASLVARGLVRQDFGGLTDDGFELREAIEAETNRRAQSSFDVLDEATANEFLSVVRRIPGEVD